MKISTLNVRTVHSERNARNRSRSTYFQRVTKSRSTAYILFALLVTILALGAVYVSTLQIAQQTSRGFADTDTEADQTGTNRIAGKPHEWKGEWRGHAQFAFGSRHGARSKGDVRADKGRRYYPDRGRKIRGLIREH